MILSCMCVLQGITEDDSLPSSTEGASSTTPAVFGENLSSRVTMSMTNGASIPLPPDNGLDDGSDSEAQAASGIFFLQTIELNWTLVCRLILDIRLINLISKRSTNNRSYTSDELSTWVEQSQDLMLRTTASFLINS